MIGKQKKLILIFTIVVAVMLGLYLFVVTPLVNKVEEETTVPLETQAGEEIGISDRYMMFPQIEKSEMQSIFVHNEYGDYKFYRDANDNFQIEGFEGVPYDPEKFSSLVVGCGYTLSKLKVVEDATEQQLIDYGLDTSNDLPYYILTTLDGTEHKVYVGAELLTGGGYYCMYEGRNAVYVLDTTLKDTVLSPIESMVQPVIMTGVDSNTYFYIDNFNIMKGEELFISVGTVPKEEQFNEDALIEHRLNYPAPYTPSSTTYYEVLSKFTTLIGDSCYKLGVDEEAIEETGLENPAYTIYFTYPSQETGETYEYLIMISEKQEDGNYYVLSSLFDLIATVSSETFNFLEWDLIKWIERPIFQMNINTVETMKIESPEITDTYHLSGEGEELVVVSDTAGQFEDVYNFRQFYKTLLTISIEDYATITEEEIDALIADENNCALTYTVTTRKGNTTVYKFYPYSTRRAVVTINGDGEFYVLRDSVDKIINDTKRVIANEPIDSYGAD